MSDGKCLLVIDVQVGIFNLKQPVFEPENLIGNIKSLIATAREKKYPVIFTRHENKTFLKKDSSDWEIVHELQPEPTDNYIGKKHPSIFKETTLEEMLGEANLKELIICGLITNGCVQQACSEALEKGYDVTLISDGHSTFYKNPEKIINEWNSKLEKMGVTIKNTNAWDG